MIKGLSASLVAAAAEINKKSRVAFQAEQAVVAAVKKKLPGVSAPKADPAAVPDAAKKMAEETSGSAPRTPKEKELAAMSGHKKKITFGDVLKARGVRKEEIEQADEAAGWNPIKHIPKEKQNDAIKTAAKDVKRGSYADRAALLRAGGVKEEAEVQQEGWDDMMKASKEPKGTGKFDKKEIKPGVTQYTRKSSTFDDGTGKDSDERRQDRQRRKGVSEGLMATLKKISQKAIKTVGHGSDEDLRKDLQKKMGMPQTGKKPVAENMDTPGNSTHQCAIHVKSEQFGEGRCLTTQHADPVDGVVQWYDVMFAEGIKRVNVADVEVVEAMMHGHAPKKKAK